MDAGYGLVRVFWRPKSFQNAAFGNRSASALCDQARQLSAKGCQVSDLPVHGIEMLSGEGVHLTARTIPIVSKAKERSDLIKAEPNIAGASNETQPCDFTGAIAPVVPSRSSHFWEQADLFIIADSFDRSSGCLSKLTDRHPEHCLTL